MKTKYSKRITIGYDESGNEIRRRFYGSTKAELEEVIRQFKNEQELYSCPDKITFRVYSEKWFDTYKSNKGIRTQIMYKDCLRLCGKIDDIPLRDITRTDAQMLINDNYEHPRTCEKLSMCLKQIFREAVIDGLMLRNVAEKLELPKRPKIQRRCLTDTEKKALKKARLRDEDKMYVNILYYFGLRPGEALALMRGDFNLKTKMLTVSRAVTYHYNDPILKGTKTDNVRVLPIPDQLVPKLKDYLKGLNGFLLFSRNEKPLTHSAHVRMWERIKNAWNLAMGGTDHLSVLAPDITEYIFRRTYATNLYYSGISIKKAAYLMGHSDTTMILKVYAQIDDERENLDAIKALAL